MKTIQELFWSYARGAMLLFTSLIIIGEFANAAVTIPLNDPKIYYDGVLYQNISAGSVIFNRHTPATYADPSSGIVYAPCNRTRATQSGVRIRFKTSSPHIKLTFAPQMSPDGYFFGHNYDGSYSATGPAPNNGFAVFADGVSLTTFSSLTFTINHPAPGVSKIFEVTLPNLWSVTFTGFELDNGYALDDAGINTKPKYAAFGTSITMGTGQYVNTAKTYAFKVAQAKGWNLFNFAVAGSTVGWQLAYDIKGKQFDYITIEQGFNDWASQYSQPLPIVQDIYAKFIDSLRMFQPTAKIYCIAPIVTTYTAPAPKYTLDEFRTMVSNLVSTRKANGDNNIFYINGATISDPSMLDDGIHMNEYGADKLATSLVPLLGGNVTPPPPPPSGFIPASNSNFQYTGRFDFTNTARPQFSFPGTSIKAKFQGTSVSVVIKDYAMGGDQNTNYFNVIIDNNAPIKLQVNNTDTLYAVSSTLADGDHTIEIFKRTESSVGKSEFRGLLIANGKTLLAPNVRPTKRIEFIGDSYTCGYGDEVSIPQSGNPNTGFHSTNENNYTAWGAVASRALNAEYVCTAYSGRGMYRNNTGSTSGTLPQIYDQIIADQSTPSWNKNNFIPDIVVIHLGTNDFFPIANGNALDSASFVNTYISFVTKLRGYYPSACIVCAVPNGLSDWYPTGAYNLTKGKSYINTIVNYFKNKGDNKVYNFVMTPQGSQGEPYGEDWHPSSQTQQIMANDLVNFLSNVTGCGGSSTTQNPTINFNNTTKQYGDASFALTATSNSSGAFTYSITSGNQFATITPSGQVTIKGAGTVTVKVDQSAAAGFNAGSATATLTINKAPLTARADDKSKVAGSINPPLTITYTGFVYGETFAVLTQAPAISTTATTSSPAGTYPIVLTGGSAANYSITLQNGTLTITNVNTQDPVIQFQNISKKYGDNPFTVAASSNSSGTFTYSISSGNQFASITPSGQVTIKGAGTVVIKVDQSAANGFNAGSASATLTINKAPLTITADDKTRMYGTANPVFTITCNGFVYGENISNIVSPSITCNASTSSNVGTYPINLSGGSSSNYNFQLINGTLTITQATPSLNYTGALNGTVGTSIVLSASSPSDGAITFSFTNGTGTASISGNNLNLISAGNVVLIVSQQATINYAAASISVSITIKNNTTGGCTVNSWDVQKVYNGGEQVLYNDKVYFAKWYTQGNIPGLDQWGPWQLLGLCSDMGSCNAFAWNNGIAYFQGVKVSYNGNVYTAKWWTQGNVPSNDPYGPWQLNGPCGNNSGTCNVPSWDAQATYWGGTEALYNGNIYKAKWWTLGNIPGADQWGPWELEGPCVSMQNTSNAMVASNTQSEDAIVAYPTIATDFITVKVNLAQPAPVKIALYNFNNEEVILIENSNVSLAVKEYTVKVSDLSSGIYFLKLITPDEVITTKICK